jgi:hypothetical protein
VCRTDLAHCAAELEHKVCSAQAAHAGQGDGELGVAEGLIARQRGVGIYAEQVDFVARAGAKVANNVAGIRSIKSLICTLFYLVSKTNQALLRCRTALALCVIIAFFSL